MDDTYQILLEGAVAEIEEKKSRFIATIAPVNSEEEADRFIQERKKQFWDARHNVPAYVIGPRAELTRCSDDGEPAGTAGRPALEVLLGSGVRNCCVVVTRYFGGTLLGTGGLVRAYTQSVKEALLKCQTGIMVPGTELLLTSDYNDIGKILYYLGQKHIEPLSSEYGADVQLKVVVPSIDKVNFCKDITEACAGRAEIEVNAEYSFIKKCN